MNNGLSQRMGQALGLWAAVLVLLMGLWADLSPETLITRCAIGFLIFSAVGYIAGIILQRVLSEKSEDTIEKDTEDAGKAMESI